MKKSAPAAPLIAITPPKKAGLLRKGARLGAAVIAARVAAATGKKGIVGLVAGAGAKRLIMRHPMGALLVSGAYMAGKLYEAKREIDRKKMTKLLTDQTGAPIPIDAACKTRNT